MVHRIESAVQTEVQVHSTNLLKVVADIDAMSVSKVLPEAGSNPVQAGKSDMFSNVPSTEVKNATLALASKQTHKELQGQSKMSAARMEVHCTGTSSIKVRKKRTIKHKRAGCGSKEERAKIIAARRAESQRNKGWMSAFCDDSLDYEGLFNGKFGLNKETRDHMTKLVEDTAQKVKHVANNNKIALQHIFSIENCGDVLTMIIAAIIAISGARSVKGVKTFIMFVIQMLTGIGIFKVTRHVAQGMLDTTFDECEDPTFVYHKGEAENVAKELERLGLTVPSYLKRAMKADESTHEETKPVSICLICFIRT